MRIGWKAVVVAIGCGVTSGTAAADFLGALFPPGVPGYGTQPGVTVASRLRPETEADPIRAGAVAVRPSLAESYGYTSNVLGGPVPRGTWVVETQPSLLLLTDWSRDAIGAYVAADDRRDLQAPGQNRTDWTGSLGGSLDIGRNRLTLGAAHIDSHQDRTELDALPTDRPVAFQVNDIRASFAWLDGRWTVTPDLEASTWHYDATSILGVPASQTYRDRTVLQGGATVSYELAPQRTLVLLGRGIGQDYRHVPPGGQPLNATGYQALIGLDYAQDSVWRYRLLLGAEYRVFASAAFPARTAAIAAGEVAWLPTGMTTVTATLSRSMEDAAQEGIAGFIFTAGKLSLDHELRRDLLLHVSAGMQHAGYLQGGAQQTSYAFGLGATWLMNRYVRLSATYDLTAQRGAGATTLPLSGDYTRSLALLTIRLGL